VERRQDSASVIRQLRQRLGLTQEKFAAKLGVTFPTINRWENARTRPSPLATQRLGDLLASLGHDYADLLERLSGDTGTQPEDRE
jgi:putative transcriptional regulator